VPARDIRFGEGEGLIRLEQPRAFVKKAPHANPKAEFALADREHNSDFEFLPKLYGRRSSTKY
jgi:hypothetical protein